MEGDLEEERTWGKNVSKGRGLGEDARRTSWIQTLSRNHISTLVGHRECGRSSEHTQQALQRVGQAVALAVDRFVAIGQAISQENPELQPEMIVACKEAHVSGATIGRFAEAGHSFEDGSVEGCGATSLDRGLLVRASRLLLSAVTRVLLLADRVVVKHVVSSRHKVLSSLALLESVDSFQEFVQVFSQFGNEMVEFAHLTGDRQNDLKDEKQRAKIATARAVVEKCTMMLLTASKTCLRHPDCASAQQNRNAVFSRIRLAMDQVTEVVVDARINGEVDAHGCCIYMAINSFKDGLQVPPYPDTLKRALRIITERVEDFTDSPYTSHERRERILQLVALARQELQLLLTVPPQRNSANWTPEVSKKMDVALASSSQCMEEILKELLITATEQTSELLAAHGENGLLRQLKASAIDGDLEACSEISARLLELGDQLVETCQLLRHVAGTEPLDITCAHAGNTFRVMGPQITSAAQTLALHPSSKIACENLEVFCEAWEAQLVDMHLLLKEIKDFSHGRKGDKRRYQSLPHSVKHKCSPKLEKPVNLDVEEQAKISKLSLELRLLMADVHGEMERLGNPESVILQLVENISNMAYSMYLFTRGQGLLKTIQELFHQAEEVGGVEEWVGLSAQTEHLPHACQRLQLAARIPAHGKVATFAKVDSTIQETKHTMLLLLNIIPLCCNVAHKGSQQNRPNESLSQRQGTARGPGIASNGPSSKVGPAGTLQLGEACSMRMLQQKLLNLKMSEEK
uniref:Catenin (cadherin-associated protein), alpha-like 1 n=1 Tax=Eptatretus burgeri TaxID=7764 RepID=A0A8C4WQE4_EPTBU